MRYKEIDEKDYIGVPTPSVEQIAQKHKVPVAVIQRQLKKGTEVEQEHTKDRKVAAEIARDHLAELPDYYTELEKVEKNVKEEEEYYAPGPDSTYQQLRVLYKMAKDHGLFDAANWLHDRLSDMAKEMRY